MMHFRMKVRGNSHNQEKVKKFTEHIITLNFNILYESNKQTGLIQISLMMIDILSFRIIFGTFQTLTTKCLMNKFQTGMGNRQETLLLTVTVVGETKSCTIAKCVSEYNS